MRHFCAATIMLPPFLLDAFDVLRHLFELVFGYLTFHWACPFARGDAARVWCAQYESAGLSTRSVWLLVVGVSAMSLSLMLFAAVTLSHPEAAAAETAPPKPAKPKKRGEENRELYALLCSQGKSARI